MRASVLREGRMVVRDDVAEPVPMQGQVLVDVKACGICGSDLHFATHGDQMIRLTREMTGMPIEGGLRVDLARDVFMGHEFSAEVLEAGPDTEAPPPGTMVTSLPVLLSPSGFEPIISSNTTIGGYAERMLLSAPFLLTIPNGLDPRLASLTEPMAVSLHAVNKSSIEPGDAALVIGCGRIGLAIGFASPDYFTVDLACGYLGLVSVPLQQNASVSALGPIIAETEPKVLAVGAQYLDLAVELALTSRSLRHLLVFDFEPGADDHRDGIERARAS